MTMTEFITPFLYIIFFCLSPRAIQLILFLYMRVKNAVHSEKSNAYG